ncbi:glycosyltransferase family protein [Dactylosporangium salmoneum]|uniref:Spore protein YkvP/CgeB glycosyl transferase-like domain-containing protein n=1 Tax=Dactylosporangium salmoneum TaxID=53361 RepID=A0ABP5T1M7_9ACTN
MRIGYSFWGFLGNGITDTPDGGRSHRRPLIDALLSRGHDIVFLQADRDRLEACDDLGGSYAFDAGLPGIDVLFLEWRWAITGRNTTVCGSAGHTCDLHRQAQLIDHYTVGHQTPTVIWDKDRTLPADSMWRRTAHTLICEAALAPTPGAHSLLFPVADDLLAQADPAVLAARPRDLALAYVGNQYDRDEPFDRFFAPAADRIEHLVAGKWTKTDRWPNVRFAGRIPFKATAGVYGRSLATVLMLPERYAAAGQMTQRIFEAVLAGCLPLAPADIRFADRFVPRELIVGSGADVTERLTYLREISGSQQHADLIAACVDRLHLFGLNKQLDALQDAMHRLVQTTANKRSAV